MASQYGAGQPLDIAPEFSHPIVFATLLAVGYGEWLEGWTFPEDDERRGMSSLPEMIEWNKANNDSTGALGNNTWWWDEETGQSFYDAGAATNGTMGADFWAAFGNVRMMSRQAIDTAHAYVTEEGEIIALDGLLMPNGRAGNRGNACAPVPSFAGYPIAAVPIGQDDYSTPFGLCVYGRQYGETKLVKVASAMEDLFQWNEKPRWWNYDTAEGPWDLAYPGYVCSIESLDRGACEPESLDS